MRTVIAQVNSLDVKTNLLATLVASGTSDEMDAVCKKYQISMEDGFEVTFNEACNHIAMGHIDMAQEFLEAALRAGELHCAAQQNVKRVVYRAGVIVGGWL